MSPGEACAPYLIVESTAGGGVVGAGAESQPHVGVIKKSQSRLPAPALIADKHCVCQKVVLIIQEVVAMLVCDWSPGAWSGWTGSSVVRGFPL